MSSTSRSGGCVVNVCTASRPVAVERTAKASSVKMRVSTDRRSSSSSQMPMVNARMTGHDDVRSAPAEAVFRCRSGSGTGGRHQAVVVGVDDDLHAIAQLELGQD